MGTEQDAVSWRETRLRGARISNAPTTIATTIVAELRRPFRVSVCRVKTSFPPPVLAIASDRHGSSSVSTSFGCTTGMGR